MIDTDKYEGHTPAPWVVKNSPLHVTHLYGRNNRKICSIQTPDGMFAKTKDELKLSRECNTNAQLIIDAPILLEEVKRLQEENKVLAKAIKEDNEILKKHIETLAEVKRLRGLLQEVADDYTDADGITYEIYCEFGIQGDE